MKLTYYGHSCFLLDTGSHQILFDPFIRGNELAKHIHVDEISPDFICLSHAHQDHMADCEEIANRSGALVICNWEIHEWLNKKGMTNTHPMNMGGWRQFGFGRLRCVAALHSSMLPDGNNGGNPMGFVLEIADKKIYYAGDTALTMDMKLVGEYWKPDIALLPLGGNFTMDVEDALLCSDFIQCNTIVGMHFDTFGYIVMDKSAAAKAFADRHKTLHLMDIGKTRDI
ncbi:MAG: metal-dependent hydrolase [Flavobacteriaceae bacterium]|nr:metal-dependent hydrolase [Flavobacteriaceae bacterium]